jgi:hypothetical protein
MGHRRARHEPNAYRREPTVTAHSATGVWGDVARPLPAAFVAWLDRRMGIRLNPGELMYQTLGQLAAVCDERRNARSGPARSSNRFLSAIVSRVLGRFFRAPR